ncbi:hypothetical protein PPNSA23_23700 [Phyllobacterium phragmitis]|uniref:Uncharacterized protein n=1 Tax=Phyllobacterium phragmitis TaxID=2670329 RepID=A0ABQ0H0J3_9HYPH
MCRAWEAVAGWLHHPAHARPYYDKNYLHVGTVIVQLPRVNGKNSGNSPEAGFRPERSLLLAIANLISTCLD